MYKKVLVLGGTGAIGSKLIEILAENNYEVFVTSRKYNVNKLKNVYFIQGNSLDTNFVKSLMSVKYYAIIDFMKYYDMDIFTKNMEVLLSGTKQYIYLSSATVYASMEGRITEETKRLMDVMDEKMISSPYVKNKCLQEDFLNKSGTHNWTIVRPYISYSEKRLQLGNFEKEDWLYRALKGRTIVLSKEVASHVTTMTHGQDVALAISKLIGNENVLGETIQVMNPQYMKWEDILSIYLKVLEETTARKVNVLLYDRKDILRASFDRTCDRMFECKKLKKIYAIDYVKNEVGLTDCLTKFITGNGEFLNIDWTKQAMMDRLTSEVTLLEEIVEKKDQRLYALVRWDGYVINEELLCENSEIVKWNKRLYEFAEEDWQKIERVLGGEKRIGIYAATLGAKRIISAYERMGNSDNISLYDSSEKTWNQYIGKVKIQAPSYLSKERPDCLLIANEKHYNAIYESCRFLEMDGVQIFSVNNIFGN